MHLFLCPNDLKTISFFRCQFRSNSLQRHRLQHTRHPCPSPSPGVHPSSRPCNWWCHPIVASPSSPSAFTLFSPFYRWGNWGSLPKDTQPADKARIWIQGGLFQSSYSYRMQYSTSTYEEIKKRFYEAKHGKVLRIPEFRQWVYGWSMHILFSIFMHIQTFSWWNSWGKI